MAGSRLKGLITAGVVAVLVVGGVTTATVLIRGQQGANDLTVATQSPATQSPATQSPATQSPATQSPATQSTVTAPGSAGTPMAVATGVPVLPSPVMTLPAPKPTKPPPEPVDGKFKVVRTVTKSNQTSVRVGAKETYTWTIPVLCDPYCAAIDPGGDVKVKGRTWTYSYAAIFTCYRTTSAGKVYDKKKGTTTNKVVLRFSTPGKGKPQTFSGTIKERLKKQCRGYQGEFKPWSVNYKLKGTFTGKKK